MNVERVKKAYRHEGKKSLGSKRVKIIDVFSKLSDGILILFDFTLEH